MKRFLLVAALIAGGLLWTGCRTCPFGGGGKAAPAASQTQRRTVEFVQHSEADLREHYAQWAREGWAVESLSAPLPQADGTILRRAELFRGGPVVAADH